MVVMTAPAVPGASVADGPFGRRTRVVVAVVAPRAVPRDHPDGEEPA